MLTLLLKTFFQSGVLEWRDGEASWYFRSAAFNLFISIVVPLTVALLFGWMLLYVFGKSKSRDGRKRVEEYTAP